MDRINQVPIISETTEAQRNPLASLGRLIASAKRREVSLDGSALKGAPETSQAASGIFENN
jgi:hypothetical protein